MVSPPPGDTGELKDEILASLALGAGVAVGGAAYGQSSFVADGASFSADGFYIYGFVELSYVGDNFSSERFLRGDLDLGFSPTAGISSFPIGFALGIDAFDFGGSGSETALYPTVIVATNFGEFSAGVPRSVLDRGYLPENIFARSTYLDLELSLLRGSFVNYAYLLGDEIPWGVRYDGEFGTTRVGFSYNRIDDPGSGVDAFGAAFRNELDAVSSFYEMAFFGGIEHFRDSSYSETSFTIGVEGGSDGLVGGLSYTNSNFFGGVDTVSTYVDFDVTDDFTLSGSVLNFSGSGPSDTIYGIAGEYRLQITPMSTRATSTTTAVPAMGSMRFRSAGGSETRAARSGA